MSEEGRTVPAHVEAVIGRVLEKVPADRFATAGETARALGDPGFRWGERAVGGALARGGVAAAWKHATIAFATLTAILASGWALARSPSTSGSALTYSQLLLPDGVRISTGTSDPLAISADGRGVAYTAIDEGETVISTFVTASGVLVFSRGLGELWAAGLAADRSSLESEPVLMLDGGPGGVSNARYSLSGDGTLVYLPEGLVGGTDRRVLAWVERDGGVEDIVSIPDVLPNVADAGRDSMVPRLSPDGSRIAFRAYLGDAPQFGVFVWHLEGGGWARLPVELNADWPVWIDNERLIFNRFDEEGQDLYIAPADGSGTPVPWTAPNEVQQHAQQVTPDGTALLIQQRPYRDDPDSDLLVAPFDDPERASPVFDLPEPSAEVQGSIDSTGRWLAYASNQSGRFEVYITQFPRGLTHTRVSQGGGTSPIWSPAGGELFYRRGFEIRVVSVATEPVLQLGIDEVLFDRPNDYCCPQGGYSRTFDVSADGRRILVVRQDVVADDPTAPDVPRLEMVQGWVQQVEQRLPR